MDGRGDALGLLMTVGWEGAPLVVTGAADESIPVVVVMVVFASDPDADTRVMENSCHI